MELLATSALRFDESQHYQQWNLQSVSGESHRMWNSLNDLVEEYKKENEAVSKTKAVNDSTLKASSLVIPNGKIFTQK